MKIKDEVPPRRPYSHSQIHTPTAKAPLPSLAPSHPPQQVQAHLGLGCQTYGVDASANDAPELGQEKMTDIESELPARSSANIGMGCVVYWGVEVTDISSDQPLGQPSCRYIASWGKFQVCVCVCVCVCYSPRSPVRGTSWAHGTSGN